MIETYLLESLLAVQKCGTLSAAAEQLHVAQPSVTRSMQKLESLFGVPLFERSKNRVALNAAGTLAAEYARRILDEEDRMLRHVRAYDRSLHALSVGACAPGPLISLAPVTSGLYADRTFSSSVADEKALLAGLQASDYSVIVLPHPVDSPELFCQYYRSEQLFLSVNCFHPAAAYKEISFAETDGQNFIMYAQVGFWDRIVREKMPRSKFYLQNDIEAVGELAKYSDLPSFATDITLEHMTSRQNDRLYIPFSDPEAAADYYLICRKEAYPTWKKLFQAACE